MLIGSDCDMVDDELCFVEFEEVFDFLYDFRLNIFCVLFKGEFVVFGGNFLLLLESSEILRD